MDINIEKEESSSSSDDDTTGKINKKKFIMF
jgi:hypothetical protein